MGDGAPPRRQVALVLGGAVTKGAFEAGALEVLASRDIAVRRIVAASSGALNGTAYAAGVRARRETFAARDLVEVWEREANLCGVVHPSLPAIWGRLGISDQKKLLRLLRRRVKPRERMDPAPIELHIVVAELHGEETGVGDERVNSYCRMLSFADGDFDDAAGLERVFRAATASAALPVLFAPVEIPGVGPCSDGGLVNNTPILAGFGRDRGADLDAIIVVTPTPSRVKVPVNRLSGMRLVAHQLDMVFAEWLHQDMLRAMDRNRALDRLAEIAAQNGWGEDQVEDVKAAFGLAGARRVPIIAIRPFTPLPGTLFSGFTDARIRRAYVELGRDCARQALDEAGFG